MDRQQSSASRWCGSQPEPDLGWGVMQGGWKLNGLHHNRLVGGLAASVQGPVNLHMTTSLRMGTA